MEGRPPFKGKPVSKACLSHPISIDGCDDNCTGHKPYRAFECTGLQRHFVLHFRRWRKWVSNLWILKIMQSVKIIILCAAFYNDRSSIPKSVTHSRKSKFAKDGAELDLLLKSARAGDFIQLGRGEYKGNFQVPDKVTLKGVLPGTVISSTNRRDINQNRPRTNSKPLMVVGSDAKISDLQFECNFHQLGPRLGLQILGFRNTVTNIIFINCSFIPHGKHNIVKNVKHLT